MEIIWLFSILCMSDCDKEERNPVENSYFYANDEIHCQERAQDLIRQKGMTGNLQIQCKPFKRTIKLIPSTGM